MSATDAPATLAVVMPTWLGDCVMATPLLRALRQGWPGTRIVGVVGGNVAPVLAGLASLDAIEPVDGKPSSVRLARQLRSLHADVALLLPNAFRSAAAAWLARVPRRIGYARDGRGLLLTDKVAAPRVGRWPRRSHAVVPAVRHYLGLLAAMNLPEAGRRLELSLVDADTAAADAVAASAGLGNKPLAVFVPGGRYGSAKLWPSEHFAALAHRLAGDGFDVGLSIAPGEREVADAIANGSPAIDLSKHGLSLHAAKGLLARADVVVTNDTGARHVAVAFGRRVVTLFGPTDPKRTTLDHPLERELWLDDVPCRPCQLKRCPLPEPQTQRCLRELTPDRVLEACRALLDAA